MADNEREQPAMSDAARRRQDEQRDRLAVSLRENLRKRKQQSRTRAGSKPEPPDDAR